MLIFLVVFGHMISTFADTPEVDVIYKIIFSFHMPAFIFVSGYFAKVEPKKILSRIFPLYIVFQLLRFLLDFILDSIMWGHPVKIDMQFFTPRWTLWYLMAMIIYHLLLYQLSTLTSARDSLYSQDCKLYGNVQNYDVFDVFSCRIL